MITIPKKLKDIHVGVELRIDGVYFGCFGVEFKRVGNRRELVYTFRYDALLVGQVLTLTGHELEAKEVEILTH